MIAQALQVMIVLGVVAMIGDLMFGPGMPPEARRMVRNPECCLSDFWRRPTSSCTSSSWRCDTGTERERKVDRQEEEKQIQKAIRQYDIFTYLIIAIVGIPVIAMWIGLIVQASNHIAP